jgi:hypothetical protein
MERALPTEYQPGTQPLPDVIPLDVAAKVAGRSPKTVRSWVHQGFLDDKRTPGDTRGRLLVSTRQLLAHLAGTTPAPPTATPALPLVEYPRVPEADDHNALVATLERENEELRTDKRRLFADVDALRHELEDTRRQLEDLRRSKAAVEKELNGGVRGLLRRLF